MAEPRQAYANARLHARHAGLPGAAQWGALEASRTPEHYVDVLRAARWLHVPEGAHAIAVDAREFWLRSAWRVSCEEVARWHPERWRPAFLWLSVLTDLDALERIRAGEALPSWLASDERLSALVQAPVADRDACLRAGEYGVLRDAWRRPVPLVHAWLQHWHAAWPPTSARVRTELARLESAVAGAAALELPARREALEAAAARAFRRGAGTPVAGFAHLLCVALQLERVRGGLARRALPPGAAA
jgi:hypothetical protein